ncbi:CAP domain-containing protein [Cohnella fermenti]|uniref:CAP domain-containing protein n=1 Tax=Cohnella fermenti TaxID=2565925 RepID=UPI001E6246A6|nr:CAP domain-containing protein [Cohnella fermenti]
MLKNKRLGKLVLSGSLVLALSIPAAVGSASAASASGGNAATTTAYSANFSWSQLASQYGIDLNSIFKQIQGGNWSNGSTSGNYGSGSSGSGSQSGNSGSSGSNSGSGNTGSGSNGSGSSDSGSTAAQSDYAAQVVSLVNEQRAAAGLGALTTDTKLTQVALAKAKDMYNNNYFDHTSPTYGSPFDMMKQFGVSYSYAGENIAKGQQNPEAVMTAWMNSSGHKANILGSNYTSIGVAYYNGVWVQEFTG